ncbi:MAG: TetR/AcrR family transcriptional regulator [Alphaproteobacteria bacterium]
MASQGTALKGRVAAGEKAVRTPARRRPAAVRRDPERTRENILKAAQVEFCRKGLSGARVERIATRAGANMRMLYHYFGNKEGLYLAVLERVYERIRSEERKLDLGHLDPVEGMTRLVDFTFSHFARNPDFMTLLGNENLLRARYLKRSKKMPAMTSPLVAAIGDLLGRGEREGVFRSGVDPIQLYVSITALSYLHVANRHTLSTIFRRDLADPDWLEARRAHAREMILGSLAPAGDGGAMIV